MARDEEELEFISVGADDDNDDGSMSQSYGTSNSGGRGGGYDNVIGNWILNQSKVCKKCNTN
jgi:hypothetical protein